MRDHSLHATNRLAQEGEELVLCRFSSGVLGFAANADLLKAESIVRTEPRNFWSRLKESLLGRRAARFPAVCVPPGARLLLDGVPPNVQTSLQVAPSEVVVFAEISDRSYSYREVLLLPDETRVLLQDLPEGVHALVLALSSPPVNKPVNESLARGIASPGSKAEPAYRVHQ
jgi:hypothetical protein